jgi:hypothetical protein
LFPSLHVQLVCVLVPAAASTPAAAARTRDAVGTRSHHFSWGHSAHSSHVCTVSAGASDGLIVGSFFSLCQCAKPPDNSSLYMSILFILFFIFFIFFPSLCVNAPNASGCRRAGQGTKGRHHTVVPWPLLSGERLRMPLLGHCTHQFTSHFEKEILPEKARISAVYLTYCILPTHSVWPTPEAPCLARWLADLVPRGGFDGVTGGRGVRPAFAHGAARLDAHCAGSAPPPFAHLWQSSNDHATGLSTRLHARGVWVGRGVGSLLLCLLCAPMPEG